MTKALRFVPPTPAVGPLENNIASVFIANYLWHLRDQFVECKFLINWLYQEQKQRRNLCSKSFFQAPSPLTFLEINARYLQMNHEPYLGALLNSKAQVSTLVKRTQS